jgi:hypothetical protein
MFKIELATPGSSITKRWTAPRVTHTTRWTIILALLAVICSAIGGGLGYAALYARTGF